MHIKKATIEDFAAVNEIYIKARQFMKSMDNDQWGDVYPDEATIRSDISSGSLYLCIHEAEIAAVFMFTKGPDPDYTRLDTGAWLNEDDYCVVHRLASSGICPGAAKYCLDWAFEQSGNIRIDTYGKNLPMQSLLKKCGFEFCGTFERIEMTWLAYQRIK